MFFLDPSVAWVDFASPCTCWRKDRTDHPIVSFVHLFHMIRKELVFPSFLYIKLFELSVQVAFEFLNSSLYWWTWIQAPTCTHGNADIFVLYAYAAFTILVLSYVAIDTLPHSSALLGFTVVLHSRSDKETTARLSYANFSAPLSTWYHRSQVLLVLKYRIQYGSGT